MKYVKTFEDLKDMYSGRDIGKTNSIYFIVTENEKWVIRNSIRKSIDDGKLIFLTNIDDASYFPKITHYYSFENESDAQKAINDINNGPFGWEGIDNGGTEPKPNMYSKDKVNWDKDKLPYRGYLEFNNSGGRHNNMKKEYPDMNIDGLTYTINGYEFKEDNYNRYRPYQQSQQSMLYLTDLRGKLKVVKYTYGLMRDEGLNF